MAGMAGLEPASEGVKVPCLTAWLHPCIGAEKAWTGAEAPALPPVLYGVGKGTRTLGLQSHNLTR